MNKNLFAWAIYDFANSFVQVPLGGLFLAQWVVLDKGFPDIWYGGTFALATILVLLTSPFWGAWSDQVRKRWPFVKCITIVMLVLLGLLAVIAPSSLAATPRVFLVLGVSVIIQYFYQISVIFYNTLLKNVSEPATRGQIAGIGEGFSNAGWIVATAILLPFATNKITIWGEPGRAQVFLPAFLFFVILFLPTLVLFRERDYTPRTVSRATGLMVIYRKTIQGFRELASNYRNVALFLLAFSFLSDVILTIQLYFAIIMDQLYRISDVQKFAVLLVMFFFMIVGGYLLGKIGDRTSIKLVLLVSCLDLLLIFALAVLSSNLLVLYLLASVGGVGWGGFYVTSRALLIRISPESKLGEYFGFYSVFQRFASIIGPLVWGTVTLLQRNAGVFKYQAAVFVLLFLMIIGICLLLPVQDKQTDFHP